MGILYLWVENTCVMKSGNTNGLLTYILHTGNNTIHIHDNHYIRIINEMDHTHTQLMVGSVVLDQHGGYMVYSYL